MERSEKLQWTMGMMGFMFALAVGVINFITNYFFHQMGLQESFVIAGVIEMFPIATVLGITGWYRTPVTKIAQVAILLACAPLCILSDYQGFPGIWFLTMALVLLHKYGYLEKWTYVKLGAIGVWGFGWMAVSVVRSSSEEVPAIWVLKIIMYLCMVIFFLYFTFEADLIKVTREYVILAREMERKRTLAKIGETTAGVVHSLKNNLNVFSVGLMYIESGMNTEKGIATIRRGINTMSERLQSLLEMTRINEDGKAEPINLGTFILGTFNLLYADQYARDAIAFKHNHGNAALIVKKVQFVMLLENIFQNAMEAFEELKEPPTDRYVEVDVVERGFVIRNNAGHFPGCSRCTTLSCLDCDRFKKIGWTTKEYGSGNGLSYVVRTCREFGWNFAIVNVGEDVVEFRFTWS